MAITSHARAVASPGDHGLLGGLLDDDHTQYLLLAGRSGGQVLDAASAGLHMRWRDNSLVTLMELDDSGDALLEVFSTTQGTRPAPPMTEAQRDLIGSPGAGLLVFNTDTGQLNQYNGSAWTVPGAGLTTLQGAYLNDPTGAQIVLNATPDPVAVQASVAGDVLLAQDLGGNNILQVSADPDMIEADATITVRDPFLNAAASNSIVFADTFTTGGGFLGGAQLSNGTVTYNNSFFIWALLQESKAYEALAGPGFAAFTGFNFLARIFSGSQDLVQALVLNAGVVHDRTASGTSNVAQATTVSHACQARASASGAVLTYTTGMQLGRFAPTFSTVAGSTVNFGALVGVDCLNPTVALFQPSAGTENMSSYTGLRVAAIPFGGTVPKAAVSSSIAAAANAYCILNLGGAESFFGNGNATFNDNAGVLFGTGDDVLANWNGSEYELAPASGDDLRFGFATDVHTISSGSANPEFRIVADSMHLGAAGSVGNQIFNFAAPAWSPAVGGEASQVLLTQAGNVTKDVALTGLFAWTINSLSLTNGSGSVSGDVATLNVGGMTTSLLDTAETMAIRATGRLRRRGTEQVPPINPSNLTGNVDAWAGLLTASQNNNARGWARITCDAATQLRGIDATGAYDGDTYDLTNVGANSLTIVNQDPTPAATDRIILGAHGGTLAVDETVTLRYDGTTQRWRVIST